MIKNKIAIITSLCIVILTLAANVYAQQTLQTIQSNTFITQVGNPKDPRPGGSGNFTFYCQADLQWNNVCQPPDGESPLYYDPSIQLSGCGPTSMAMIISSLGLAIKPDEMDKLFIEFGARQCDPRYDGSNINAFINSGWLKDHGFEVKPVPIPGNKFDLGVVKNFTDSGYLIIAGSLPASDGSGQMPCPAQTPGEMWCIPGSYVNHIFVVDGADPANNLLHMRDPMNCRPESPQENPKYILRANNFPILNAFAIRRQQ